MDQDRRTAVRSHAVSAGRVRAACGVQPYVSAPHMLLCWARLARPGVTRCHRPPRETGESLSRANTQPHTPQDDGTGDGAGMSRELPKALGLFTGQSNEICSPQKAPPDAGCLRPTEASPERRPHVQLWPQTTRTKPTPGLSGTESGSVQTRGRRCGEWRDSTQGENPERPPPETAAATGPPPQTQGQGSISVPLSSLTRHGASTCPTDTCFQAQKPGGQPRQEAPR